MNKRRNDHEEICNLHTRNRPPYILTTFILRGDLDRFNPIAEEKNVYAVAKGYGVPDYHHKGRAMYSLKGVDELSNEKNIKLERTRLMILQEKFT